MGQQQIRAAQPQRFEQMIGGREDEIDDHMDVDEFEAPVNNPWLN